MTTESEKPIEVPTYGYPSKLKDGMAEEKKSCESKKVPTSRPYFFIKSDYINTDRILEVNSEHSTLKRPLD